MIEQKLDEVLTRIKTMLLAKNAAYGNSAFKPISIFAKGNPIEQIDTRIDDKLNRIAHGHEYHGDDTIMDLIGYLILRIVVAEILEEV
jgi:hypothetical protein